MRLIGSGLLLIVVVLCAGTASAQPSEDRDLDSDLRRDLERIGPDVPPLPGTASGKAFEVVLTAPLLLTDNARQSTGDVERQSPRGDVHFLPDILFRWSRQFANVKLTTTADASVDRFTSETDQDEDTLFGSFKLALTDGQSALFVPYAAYAVTADFRPNFAEPDDVLHSFSVGASSGIGLDGGGNLIRFRDAVEPGHRSIAFDLSVGRRLADPHDFENTFAIALIDFSYVASSTLTFGATSKLRMRWYDAFQGAYRRDGQVTGILRAAWSPGWLTRAIPSAEIDLTVSFLKNYSTLESARFSQWEGGPALSQAWRF